MSAAALDARTVRIERTLIEVAGKPLHFGPPKTEAGKRIPIPAIIMPELREHLERFAAKGEDGLVFVGEQGRDAET